MTIALTINIILAATVVIAVVGLLGHAIHVSKTLPEPGLRRLRSSREHPAAPRRPAYRSISPQA